MPGSNRKKKRSHSANANSGRKRSRLAKPGGDVQKTDSGISDVLMFQECAQAILNGSTESTDTNDAASIFFELANSPLIGYQINNHQTIVIRQDGNCAIHTGGIVWETSYLLAQFLTEKYGSDSNDDTINHHPLGKTLEIGAGCGMLGLILATNGLSSKVVLTEAYEVMANLKENVDENVIGKGDSISPYEQKSQMRGVHRTKYQPACPKHCVSVRQLRWDHIKTDIKACGANSNSKCASEHDLEPHSFDTIIGTDVVFAPALVSPLLKTISKMARKKKKKSKKTTAEKSTLIYLCLQVRCPDSHALLFAEAHKHGLEVIDVSDELKSSKCSWGLELECLILQMKVVSKKDK
ncbi:hypothetical protein ACHAXN_005465 [Cyclotella atomus]|jgi:predicted nicotinamide N-methyase